jgi:hypothetical protein
MSNKYVDEFLQETLEGMGFVKDPFSFLTFFAVLQGLMW